MSDRRGTKQTERNYCEASEDWRERLRDELGDVAARHMHLDDGFTLVAAEGEIPVALIAVVWRVLPEPLKGQVEGFIDIIEVAPLFRRHGVATRLISMAADRARAHGACQLRAWSSDDKVEAIPMWLALGFGLCPAVQHPRGQEVRGYFVARTL